MSILRRFSPALHSSSAEAKLWVLYSRDAAIYQVSVARPDSEAIEVESPLAIHYLNELVIEEKAEEHENSYVLGWATIYQLLAQPEHRTGLQSLGLPTLGRLIPALRSDNTLDDPDFSVGIDGWFEGSMSVGAVELMGPIARRGNSMSLLSPEAYDVVRAIQDFFAANDHSPDVNRWHWGRLRNLALRAGARMDQFLTDTIVLTPEKLHIQLCNTDINGSGVVEIQPWFSGAPDNWLEEFDRRSSVPNIYKIVRDHQLIEVVITPSVLTVLRAIKKMPGRRAAGSLAEKFLNNPFAALGQDANAVIDEQQFDDARREAGITFQRFSAHCSLSGEEISQVGLLITTAEIDSPGSTIEPFRSPQELQAFVARVESRQQTGCEVCEWRGYHLQLLGDTAEQLALLKEIYREWTWPKISIRAAEVLDLKRYSERVTGIGVQPNIISPYIPRTDNDPWFPDSLREDQPSVHVSSVALEDGRIFELLVDEKVFKTLQDAVAKAKARGALSVDIPGTAGSVSVDRAQGMIDELASRFAGVAPEGKIPDAGKRKKRVREELLIRTNIGSNEYMESRATVLKFENQTQPILPKLLKPDVLLKDHQKAGVAWMQHLLMKAPGYCRGAILADDMGLGKTLQLLTVIVSTIEKNPDVDPVLIVAPVSLLENWKEEAEKFFVKTPPMLTLYGDKIGKLRASSQEIDKDLLERGFSRFLKQDWLGDAKIVLTTYESLRDFEFSLAAIRWSIMICDEAQKIKNPAAMVTRAAKKQNVGFKIACTGTPVENSLADLWCLFDFVQPGLLGALNEFGTKYRRPIECETEEQKLRVEELGAIIEPQVLRRLKTDVAKDLKEKIVVEDARKLLMSDYQRELYGGAIEQYRLRKDTDHRTPFKNQLGLLHYLRKVCTDPREPGKAFAQEPLDLVRSRNPKLDWLIRTLQKIRTQNEKAILFCEFRDMQLMLAHYIEEVFSLRPDIINGDTSTEITSSISRQKRLRAFQEKAGFGVIILSPVAIGFGVNIQAANHVIHFTRTWNPAKEDQATDRAYRIGQTRNVYVYYPIVYADEFVTFDVKLDRLLEKKRSLSGNMLNGTGDILPGEFDDVVVVGDDIFDKRILIDDADGLTPVYFEALIAALWKKRGFKFVKLTPIVGDGGIDVVAKTVNVGELIQVKFSATEDALIGWDAVKEVVGGEGLYKLKFPGVHFKKIVLTNRRFNDNARMQAEINNTELVERGRLAELLNEHRVVMGDLEAFLQLPEQIAF